MQRLTKPNAQHSAEPGEAISGFFADSNLDMDEPMPSSLDRPAPAASNRILLVGSPGLAMGEMLTRLRGFGFPADFADGAEPALRQLAQVSYRFAILIDDGRASGAGKDAADLCRAIRKAHEGPACPHVVVVAQRRAFLPRLDAWHAGCHKYMVVPLGVHELQQYLRTYSANREG